MELMASELNFGGKTFVLFRRVLAWLSSQSDFPLRSSATFPLVFGLVRVWDLIIINLVGPPNDKREIRLDF